MGAADDARDARDAHGADDPVIVRAGAERLDELEPLWEALRQHHHAVMPSLGPLRDRADSWRIRREHYEKWLAAPGGFLLVAEQGGTPVGYALVAGGSPSQTWAIESAATLETIVLLPEARGAGLGSALIERVKDEVRAAGVTHLGLGVVGGNEDAIRFYRRHGFEPAFIEMIARP
jgi:GNAT superfamily N-acetyltransferase